jgi:hypothetical protein
MSEVDGFRSWNDVPMPEVLRQLPPEQQQELFAWVKTMVSKETEGLDDLYNAISMIVKYIPNFMVVPLMVEHIRPRIAAEVCIKMGVDQATGYANDLPLDYFSEVASHLEVTMMAQILAKMKRNQVEKFIVLTLKERPTRMLDIAIHLDRPILEIVAKRITLPADDNDFATSPYKSVIDNMRSMQ